MTAAEVPCRRPARPARCQLEAIVPGSRPSPPRPATRYRCRARGHWWPPPRVSRRPATGARSRAAPGAGSRRGSRAPYRWGWDRVAGILQIGDQDLGGQPVIGKDQGLQPRFDKLQGHPPRLGDVAAADAKLAVHHRGIVKIKTSPRGARRSFPPVRRAPRSTPRPVPWDSRWSPSSK